MTPFIALFILIAVLIVLLYMSTRKIKTKGEAGIKYMPIPAPPKPQVSSVKIIRENEIPHKCCGGVKCGTNECRCGGKCGTKKYDPIAAANAASNALDAEIDEIIGFEPTKETGRTVPTARREKDRFFTVDEIRHTAYLLAAGDNFQKNPNHYWCEAEKQLKGQL